MSGTVTESWALVAVPDLFDVTGQPAKVFFLYAKMVIIDTS